MPPDADPALPTAAPAPLTLADRIRQIPLAIRLETGVILLLAVIPDLVSASLAAMSRSPGPSPGTFGHTVGLLLRSTEIAAVVLFLMWRSGEGWAAFGLSRFRWRFDLAVGLAIYAATFLAYLALAYGFYPWLIAAGLETTGYSGVVAPRSLPAMSMVLTAALANGFAEELVMRGHLIPRFERLLGSTPAAIVLTTSLFAAYHVYQGVFGVMNAFAFGLICGLFFARTRRLWPVITAHAIADAVPFLLATLRH